MVAVATGRSGDGDEPLSLSSPRGQIWIEKARGVEESGPPRAPPDRFRRLSLAPRTPQAVMAAVSRRQLQTMQSWWKSLLENGLICR